MKALILESSSLKQQGRRDQSRLRRVSYKANRRSSIRPMTCMRPHCHPICRSMCRVFSLCWTKINVTIWSTASLPWSASSTTRLSNWRSKSCARKVGSSRRPWKRKRSHRRLHCDRCTRTGTPRRTTGASAGLSKTRRLNHLKFLPCACRTDSSKRRNESSSSVAKFNRRGAVRNLKP